MKLHTLALAALLAACCTAKSTEEPGALERAIDVAAPVAKGYLCGQEHPPGWVPDGEWSAALWAAARALFCVDTAAGELPELPADAGAD